LTVTPRHIRPEVLYQRQRQSPDRLNNSPRRTYDLLRSTLVMTGRNMRLVEHELTDALSASRNTVRAVLQRLAREGLVTREPKNGTRPTGSLLLPIDELTPFEMRALEFRRLGCPPIVRDRLRLPVGWTVLMIESIVLEDQRPLGLAVSYIALDEEQSSDVDIDEPDVILILEDQLGIRIGNSQTTVGAVAADEETAELIGVAAGAPLVWLEDVIEDEDGQPRALSQLRLRGDRVAFSATAHRSG
jgi:GntR family transcriptional regulator